MIQIIVPFDKKNDARTLGAKVIDGKWCIPDDLPDNKKKELWSLFGSKKTEDAPVSKQETPAIAPATEQKGQTKNVEVIKKEHSSWEECLCLDTLSILEAIKAHGLPENLMMRGRLFRRFTRILPGDYPITYDGLLYFYPKLGELYPKTRIKEALSGFSGDYKKEIENSKLSDDMKGLLLFVLP